MFDKKVSYKVGHRSEAYLRFFNAGASMDSNYNSNSNQYSVRIVKDSA